MTRKEAWRRAKGYLYDVLSEEEADEIIKVLEQEPILDKIRAEIMQLDYNLDSVDYDYNDMTQTEIVHMICREEVLRIIDKYRSEREPQESEKIDCKATKCERCINHSYCDYESQKREDKNE